jgi:hypothetical protein
MASEKSFITPLSRRLLVIYFSGLLLFSILILILIWNPIQGSLTAYKTQHQTILGPGKNMTQITVTKNSSTSSELRNVTKNIFIKDGNITTTIENITRKPLTGQAWNTDAELVFTNPEIRLIIFSTFFGVIGASVHGIGSLTAWISTRKLEGGWEIWYLTRPPIGAALALITYLILRAGFVSGGPTAISDFGVAAISALVGLMQDEMTTKLRDIFDTLFGIKKPSHEKGEEPIKKNQVSIGFPDDQKTEVKVGESIELKSKVANEDGTPVAKAKVLFLIDNINIAEFVGTGDKSKIDIDTDSMGLAVAKIKGLNVGKVTVTTTTKVAEVESKNNLIIKIVQ